MNEEKVKLLEVNLEDRVNFDFHVNKFASKTYHALATVYNYINKKKGRILMNAFITSQFSFCPLVWMPHSRTMTNRINKIHETALRLAYKDQRDLSLDDLLKRYKAVSIHQRNLQILATEIYKVRNDLGPEIMKDIFHFVQEIYNLKNYSTVQSRRNCTVYFGTESLSSCAPKIWETVPCETKNAKSLDIFKEKIKLWTTDKCSCRFCKSTLAM